MRRGPGRPRRRLAPALLALAVAGLHLWLAGRVLPPRLDAGDGAARPLRIEVAFVRELQLAPPPVAPPVRRAAARSPPAPALAASAAAAEALADDLPLLAQAPELGSLPPPLPELPPAPADEGAASAPAPAADPPSAAAADAPPGSAEAVAAASSAPDTAIPGLPPAPVEVASAAAAAPLQAQDFEWPPSTRLSYLLSGNYRGPVEGQAQVEWLHVGTRYQVHMDLAIGPPFAPLLSRRVSSEGEVTRTGLRPRRYDEETRVVLREPRHVVVRLDDDRVRLADGAEVPRPEGVQDSASQFVQLTWLFITQPALLRPGVAIELPLALPRRVQTWTYDVVGSETLATPVGEVPTLHLRPRREARSGGDLTAEIWFAPGLQYLPVRILIRQDAETFLDLLVERLPQQAERRR